MQEGSPYIELVQELLVDHISGLITKSEFELGIVALGIRIVQERKEAIEGGLAADLCPGESDTLSHASSECPTGYTCGSCRELTGDSW